jgi:hypothetical protein
VLAANLIIGALEALVARDAQRVAALLVQGFLLLSNDTSDIEARRVKANTGSSALLERRRQGVTTINPKLQPMMLEAEKQRLAYSALMERAQRVSTGIAIPPAAPTPYDTHSLVQPYDPLALHNLLPLPPLPQASVTTPQTTAQPTTPKSSSER